MRIQSIDKKALTLVADRKDYSMRSFVFGIGLVPNKPIPQKLVILIPGRWPHRYEMSWRKFMRQTCIGDVCLLDKSNMTMIK